MPIVVAPLTTAPAVGVMKATPSGAGGGGGGAVSLLTVTGSVAVTELA